MGNKKRTKATANVPDEIIYVPKAIDLLAKSLQDRMRSKDEKVGTPRFHVDRKGLEKAVKALPEKHRKNVEKFWGLTGGPNFSKMIAIFAMIDPGFAQMTKDAVESRSLLFKIDSLQLYNKETQDWIEMLASKIDKGGMELSDIEAVKYIMAFVIFIHNGPKMSYEDEAMEVASDNNATAIIDSYAMLQEMAKDLNQLHDKSIKLRILIDLLEDRDFKDWLAVKHSMGIKMPEDCEFPMEEVEVLENLSQIRNFKERIFQHGPWNVTTVLVLGDPEGEINLNAFMEDLEKICINSSIEEFKTGQETLRTLHELRTLNVYTIGGLEFTDPDEIQFLYMERNRLGVS